MILTPKQTADLILKQDDFLLLTHQSPDGDTLGAAYALHFALESKGKKSKVLCSNEIPPKYSYITENYIEDEFEGKYIIALDIADVRLLGEKLGEYSDKINLCIDHHETNTSYAENICLDGNAAATCELLFDVLNHMEIIWTPLIASAVYTGLTTDTGCFRYSNVTSKTHRVAASLIDYGAWSSKINRIMFELKTPARIKVEQHVLNTIEYIHENSVAVVFLTKKNLADFHATPSDIESLASIPLQIDGVKIGICCREKNDGIFKISVRTIEPINASDLCAEFGGGGHSRAAGCTINGTIPQIRHKLIESSKKYIRQI